MNMFFKQKNNKNINQNEGFTLIETLVAISIFTMSILSVMSVLAGSISNTNFAQRKIIAGYLAQEGIEEIRNIRDTYMLYSVDSTTGWTDFKNKLTTEQCTTVGCIFSNFNISTDVPFMPITAVDFFACNPSCQPLLYSESSLYAGYDYIGNPSGFTRKIIATSVPGTVDEMNITSVVSWKQGSGNFDVTLQEDLFNWIQ